MFERFHLGEERGYITSHCSDFLGEHKIKIPTLSQGTRQGWGTRFGTRF